MIGFALCHGWSFDAQAIAPLQATLRERFPNAASATFDLGFTGTAHMPVLASEVDWIAIGHSYGFAWLMQQNIPWRAAVSLNGFIRFCRRPGRPEGTPTRLVDAMLARLEQEAYGTVNDFLLRCGIAQATSTQLNEKALHEHLILLRDLDLTAPACPTLALTTNEDAIVPPALAAACFNRDNYTLREFAGDHTRLLREPQIAVDAIAEFVGRLHA